MNKNSEKKERQKNKANKHKKEKQKKCNGINAAELHELQGSTPPLKKKRDYPSPKRKKQFTLICNELAAAESIPLSQKHQMVLRKYVGCQLQDSGARPPSPDEADSRVGKGRLKLIASQDMLWKKGNTTSHRLLTGKHCQSSALCLLKVRTTLLRVNFF